MRVAAGGRRELAALAEQRVPLVDRGLIRRQEREQREIGLGVAGVRIGELDRARDRARGVEPEEVVADVRIDVRVQVVDLDAVGRGSRSCSSDLLSVCAIQTSPPASRNAATAAAIVAVVEVVALGDRAGDVAIEHDRHQLVLAADRDQRPRGRRRTSSATRSGRAARSSPAASVPRMLNSVGKLSSAIESS